MLKRFVIVGLCLTLKCFVAHYDAFSSETRGSYCRTGSQRHRNWAHPRFFEAFEVQDDSVSSDDRNSGLFVIIEKGHTRVL